MNGWLTGRCNHEDCADQVLVSADGDPRDSFLMKKILNMQGICGDPMPLLGSLTGQEILCVERWLLDNRLGGVDAGPRIDSGRPSTDAGVVPIDAGMSMMPDAGAPPEPDAGPPPVDCTPIQAATDQELCVTEADRCEGIFHDGTSCPELCALAGLQCEQSYENIDGMCLPNLGVVYECQQVGSMSDYCVCVR